MSDRTNVRPDGAGLAPIEAVAIITLARLQLSPRGARRLLECRRAHQRDAWLRALEKLPDRQNPKLLEIGRRTWLD